MACKKLLQGFEVGCDDFYNKYYQNIVLINRQDVANFLISSTDTQHRISFYLLPGKTGFLFRAPEQSSVLRASFSKSVVKGVPLYDHNMQVPVIGVNETSKVMLKNLDLSDYFGAIQFKDGTVEIYGFHYGLKTVDYDYQPQGDVGGSVIDLVSRYSEIDPPYVYQTSLTADVSDTAESHFNALFANIPDVLAGDFNDDFNDDFLIE
jgi:hypothetical protein